MADSWRGRGKAREAAGGRGGGGGRRRAAAPNAGLGARRGEEPKVPPLGLVVGVVTALTDRGYGFVTAEEWPGKAEGRTSGTGQQAPRYFFHAKGLEEGLKFGSLRQGDRLRGEAVLDEAPSGKVKGAVLVRIGRVEEGRG